MTPCRVTTSQRSVVVSVPQKNAYMAFKAASSELEHPHFSECQFEWGVALPLAEEDEAVVTREPSIQALAFEVRSLTGELAARAAQCASELAELRCSRDLLLEELDEWKAENEQLRHRHRDVEALLGTNGCDCECGHHHEEHGEDCERCLACRIAAALAGEEVANAL